MDKENLQYSLKPIVEGLFGKQNLARYERPHFEVRPIEGMVRDLTAIRPLDWCPYAFSREPLNGRLNDHQRREWMEKSLACGKEYAGRICASFQTKDPRQLAKAMGMAIEYPEFPEKTDRVLFAEYRVPNQIRIYMDAVKKGERQFDNPEIVKLLANGTDIGGLLLAHELFHFVEEQHKDEIFTKTEKIRLWSLGFLHNDSHVIALSEIAAMGFAQEIMGITYSPYVMDVFLVYGYSPEEASGLYEEMMAYVGHLGEGPEIG